MLQLEMFRELAHKATSPVLPGGSVSSNVLRRLSARSRLDVTYMKVRTALLCGGKGCTLTTSKVSLHKLLNFLAP